ncbi:MAG: PadR family transcriptional regulator [Pseudomonadales bacterium]
MALSHAIMTALLDEPLSGYDLAREFDTSLGFFWHASHQQIYQELGKLAARGWLESERVVQRGKPDKIVYALTPAGRAALDAWVAESSRRKPAKDDLLVKLYNVGHSDVAPVLEELRQRRQQHQQRLALYERIRSNHYRTPTRLPARKRGIYLALSAGIRQETASLAWCDEALKLLRPLAGPLAAKR